MFVKIVQEYSIKHMLYSFFIVSKVEINSHFTVKEMFNYLQCIHFYCFKNANGFSFLLSNNIYAYASAQKNLKKIKNKS